MMREKMPHVWRWAFQPKRQSSQLWSCPQTLSCRWTVSMWSCNPTSHSGWTDGVTESTWKKHFNTGVKQMKRCSRNEYPLIQQWCLLAGFQWSLAWCPSPLHPHCPTGSVLSRNAGREECQAGCGAHLGSSPSESSFLRHRESFAGHCCLKIKIIFKSPSLCMRARQNKWQIKCLRVQKAFWTKRNKSSLKRLFLFFINLWSRSRNILSVSSL